ncbi:MAG: helix-turn-helix transcriptional regulator [Steroidobacteraceae bacterium]
MRGPYSKTPRIPRAVAWTSTEVLSWMRAKVVEAGGDPALVPDEPTRFWRLPEVVKRTGLAEATLYRRVAKGQFPKSVSLAA